jgi:drug/metabolite transporter (DMT)-like permease
MSRESAIATTDVPRGILAICAGLAFLTLNDAVAKLLTARHDPVQILFLRNLIATPMIAAAALALRGPAALRTRRLGLHALRGLIMLSAVWFYFGALSVLPLAQATALIFAAPIVITALSVPLLGERVGPWRWGAVLLGFVGVLIVVQPGGAAFQPASLLPLGAALGYAVFMISARWLGPEEGFLTTMLFVTLFPMLYAAPFALWLWTPPRLEDLGLFAACALFGSLGITLIGQAFRIAPAAVVAPFEYTALVWATALGWAIWGDVPGGATVAGALVIVASGALIAWREARGRA